MTYPIAILAAIALAAPQLVQAKNLSRPAVQKEGTISDTDFPAEAFILKQEGNVSATYVVGQDGRASQCQISTSSGSDALDRQTCKLITERFLFDPARDVTGQATSEIKTQKVVWILPEELDGIPTDTKFLMDILMTVSPDGNVIDCDLLELTGMPATKEEKDALVAGFAEGSGFCDPGKEGMKFQKIKTNTIRKSILTVGIRPDPAE